MTRSSAHHRRQKMLVFIRALLHRYAYEPAEIEFVLHSLQRGDTAIDAGAEQGGFTYWMYRAVGPKGRVFAFEPQRECGPILRGMKRSFKMSNVTLSSYALSSRSGERDIFVPDNAPDPEASLVQQREKIFCSYRIRTTTLDSYLARRPAPRVALIKCDVEGHESEVLQGASRTLRINRPALLVEREQRHIGSEPFTDVFDFLEQFGYEAYALLRGRKIALRTFLSRRDKNSYRGAKVNNFIFLPKNDPPGISRK